MRLDIKKIRRASFLLILFLLVIVEVGWFFDFSKGTAHPEENVESVKVVKSISDIEIPNNIFEPLAMIEDLEIPQKTNQVTYDISEEEIRLIALVTMGEAEGEPEEGQRLVIDTILNRKDSPHFPDTIHDVIYQKNQFSCMWDSRIDRCYVKDELVDLVKQELINRYDSEVVFFRTLHYSQYGSPKFKVGNHYFSSYQ